MVSIDHTNGTKFAIEQSDRLIATFQLLSEKSKNLKNGFVVTQLGEVPDLG